ncbi:hypothetical protein B0A54_05503 [Friedmanniomyces endolithicus]|uniref:Uncharacterized protein n=1 Tax=Friedmanniomyces endolithicus TaxID=329885 RepID=A0A4U0V508_9PEZI|nr:hypothetical protein B0A54_05503 [Friedmanniomyces endolithicus]
MSLVETVKGLANTYHAYVFGTAFWYFLRGSMRIISPTTVAEWFRPPGQYSLGVPNPTGTFTHSPPLTANPDPQHLYYPTCDSDLPPSPDLELYNIRTDAWGLLTLAMLLLALADAVPLPASLVGSSLASPAPSQYKKPYARAAVLITLFHHLTTGWGAYQHWRLESHHTVAMDIGVYGNVGLIALGVAALGFGLRDGGEGGGGGKVKA